MPVQHRGRCKYFDILVICYTDTQAVFAPLLIVFQNLLQPVVTLYFSSFD